MISFIYDEKQISFSQWHPKINDDIKYLNLTNKTKIDRINSSYTGNTIFYFEKHFGIIQLLNIFSNKRLWKTNKNNDFVYLDTGNGVKIKILDKEIFDLLRTKEFTGYAINKDKGGLFKTSLIKTLKLNISLELDYDFNSVYLIKSKNKEFLFFDKKDSKTYEEHLVYENENELPL